MFWGLWTLKVIAFLNLFINIFVFSWSKVSLEFFSCALHSYNSSNKIKTKGCRGMWYWLHTGGGSVTCGDRWPVTCVLAGGAWIRLCAIFFPSPMSSPSHRWPITDTTHYWHYQCCCRIHQSNDYKIWLKNTLLIYHVSVMLGIHLRPLHFFIDYVPFHYSLLTRKHPMSMFCGCYHHLRHSRDA